MRRWLSYHLVKSVSAAVAMSLAVFPPERRFAAALKYARLLRLPLSIFSPSRDNPGFSPTERVLRVILQTATRRNLTFSIPLREAGMDRLHSSYRRFGRLVLCSGHFPLNGVITTVLCRHGYPVALLSWVPTTPSVSWGTRVKCDVIRARFPHTLVQARTHLAGAKVLLFEVDSHVPPRGTGGASSYQSRNGRRYVYHSFFHLAERTGTPVLFFGTRLARDGVVEVFIEAPDSTQENAASAVTTANSCARFLDRYS